MDIFKASCGAEDYVIRCRRHIHEHPERSDQEEMTIAFISGELTRRGIDHDVVPKGGVMGYIDGAKPGKTILLRADIDALPMQESPNNTKFPKACVSKIDGVAHTCGHDAHTAMLGCGNPENGMDASNHNPHFDPDESAFKYGVAATVSYTLTFLAHKEDIPFTPSLTLEEVFGSKEAAK